MSRFRTVSTILTLLFLFSTTALQAQEQAGIKSGPMVGATEMMETSIWVETTAPAELSIRYWLKDNPGVKMMSPTVTTQTENHHTATVVLTDLEMGETYEYEVLLDGKAVARDYPTEFETQELWQWRTDPPTVTVAMGSCFYVNDTPYDRPGSPYGGEYEILESIHAKNPDIMLWLGDNVYYREPDFYSLARMYYRYSHTRSTPELQPLLGSTINIATWDDHDYGPNNSDRSYRMREEALEVFKNYWPNPGYGTMETPGVFTRYKYGDVEFFLTDDRFYRAPNWLEGEDRALFGEEQMQWLKDALVNSRATFKFVVVGSQVTNEMVRDEALSTYKAEYEELMSYLRENEVWSVVFLTGDRHFTELLKTDRGDIYPIYEFTSSPLTSGTYSSVNKSREGDNPKRVDGTLVYETRNFGMLTVTGERKNRTLKMETFDVEGNQLWEFEINENDLKIRR